MPQLYRKKPETVEAVLFDGSSSGVSDITRWIQGGEYVRSSIRTRDLGRKMSVPTLAGAVSAVMGDWIVKEPDGSFRVIPPHDFKSSFEIAT